MVPRAKFVSLESRNHLLLEHEPAWGKFVDEVRGFLGRENEQTLSAMVRTAIKTCTTCGRAYSDEGLAFCRDDGTKFFKAFNPEPIFSR